MRQGDSDRDIASARLMGRGKLKTVRQVALARGWLDPARPLPDDAELAAIFGRNPKTGTEVPISPRRVMVFKPSAILKQRINGHGAGTNGAKPA